MYHQLLLTRLLDSINLVSNNSWKKDELLKTMNEKASKMLCWLNKISFKNSIDKSRNLSSENYIKMINKALKESKKFSWDNTKQQTLYLKNKNFE